MAEDQIEELAAIEIEFETAVDMRPAILFRPDSRRRQPIDHDRRDVVEPEILQQQRAAQMIEKT